jgi:hypothetical protein
MKGLQKCALFRRTPTPSTSPYYHITTNIFIYFKTLPHFRNHCSSSSKATEHEDSRRGREGQREGEGPTPRGLLFVTTVPEIPEPTGKSLGVMYGERWLFNTFFLGSEKRAGDPGPLIPGCFGFLSILSASKADMCGGSWELE